MESFTIKFKQDKPLYLQLYTALIGEISEGRLKAGEKLPSKRSLSEHLGISVNTVDTAYQMLVSEGYIAAKAKSGFYACHVQKLALISKAQYQKPEIDIGGKSYVYNFSTGSVDTKLFPFKVWGRIQRDMLSSHPELLNHGDGQGDANLRTAISEYLREYRAVTCNAEQIIVGAGIEYLLSLLAHFFEGAQIAVEDPGYARASRVLRANGVGTVAVPLDENGLCVAALEQSGAAAAYITPSHQFPSGISMPIGRRQELLAWAAEKDSRYIIEDDYDSEFRFNARPIPAMQGLDTHGRVIYIGTFSKSIAPSIRIGYMVLPMDMLARYNAEFGFYSSTVSRFEQQTLYRFISEGHFARHLNRLRSAYRTRRDTLVAALQTAFGKYAKVMPAHTGLHLLLEITNGKSEEEIVALCENAKIKITPLSEYYQTPPFARAPIFVMGFAGLSPQQIMPAAFALADAVLALH
ncbi:MAG: PLP-dependent aminotransferase family protein [Oscillospiraceae bacterium]